MSDGRTLAEAKETWRLFGHQARWRAGERWNIIPYRPLAPLHYEHGAVPENVADAPPVYYSYYREQEYTVATDERRGRVVAEGSGPVTDWIRI